MVEKPGVTAACRKHGSDHADGARSLPRAAPGPFSDALMCAFSCFDPSWVVKLEAWIYPADALSSGLVESASAVRVAVGSQLQESLRQRAQSRIRACRSPRSNLTLAYRVV